MRAYWDVVSAIVWRDFLLERRSWESLTATISFALLVVVLFHFAFDIEGREGARFFPGALWVALFFAGTVGMARTAQLEEVDGRGRAWALAPVDRSALYVGKLLSNGLLLLSVQLVVVPLFFAAFSPGAVVRPGLFAAGLLLGTWGFAAVGTLVAGAAGGERGLGLFMPLVLFPLLVPVALGAVHVVAAGLAAGAGEATGAWLRVLVVFDLLFTAVPALFYEYIVEV